MDLLKATVNLSWLLNKELLYSCTKRRWNVVQMQEKNFSSDCEDYSDPQLNSAHTSPSSWPWLQTKMQWDQVQLSTAAAAATTWLKHYTIATVRFRLFDIIWIRFIQAIGDNWDEKVEYTLKNILLIIRKANILQNICGQCLKVIPARSNFTRNVNIFFKTCMTKYTTLC